MGSLGWSERRAMRAEPLVILLAYEGWRDQRLALERTIYHALNWTLPPLVPRGAKRLGSAGSMDAKWKAFAREHNARFKAARRKGAGQQTGRTSKMRPRS